MSRYIDADELIRTIHDEWDDVLVWDESGRTTADEFERLVESAPIIELERKKGKWIKHEDSNEISCSQCGYRVIVLLNSYWKYCPNCGARMDEEKENGEIY